MMVWLIIDIPSWGNDSSVDLMPMESLMIDLLMIGLLKKKKKKDDVYIRC